MNLMDMLTGDLPGNLKVDSQNEMVSALDEAATKVAEEITQPKDAVYYLPTILTKIQQESTEIALELFSSKLLNHANSFQKKASIISLLDTSVPEDVEEMKFQEMQLIYDQLSTISIHPSLLVDHFMPKKLLLSETNESLTSTSGNLQLFNRIVDSFIRNGGEAVHMMVVASSVKELELIEASIIGKRLYYDNLSRDKLYEDRRGMPDTSKPGWVNDSRLFLYLVTTSQLYNHFTESLGDTKANFDLIFSFDTKINPDSPSIELLRPNELKTPILIPIPVFSIHHISCLIDEPRHSLGFSKNTSNPLYDYRFKIISTLAMNKHNIAECDYKNFFYNVYGATMSKFYDWFCKWKKESISFEPLEKFNEKVVLGFTDEKLIAVLKKAPSATEIDTALFGLTYKQFKSKFTELVYQRLSSLDASIEEMEGQVKKFNEKETKRQLQYDEEEEKVAEQYKKLRKSNEDAVSAEHRLGRIESELKKNEERFSCKKERLDFLKQNINSDSLQSSVTRQHEDISKLATELSNIQNQYQKLDNDNESIRANYQNTSTEAVQLSSTLSASVEYNKSLERKLKGSGASVLPSLIRKDAIMGLEQNLQRLKRENDFITTFTKSKIEKLVKERQLVMDNMNGGSTSRPSNRISKSTTPF